MGTTFSRPDSQQQETGGDEKDVSRTRNRSSETLNEAQRSQVSNTSFPAILDSVQHVEAGPSSSPLHDAMPISPQSATNGRRKKVKAKKKRPHAATQEQGTEPDEPFTSKVARTVQSDVKSQATTARTLRASRRGGAQASISALPTATGSALPASSSSNAQPDREEGELSDEDQTPTAAASTVTQTVPTAPRAALNRPARGRVRPVNQRYIDRDALVGGQSIPSAIAMSFPSTSNGGAPGGRSGPVETSSRSRPKDTQSGLNYEDDYTIPTAPVASSSWMQPAPGSHLSPPGRNAPAGGSRNPQPNGTQPNGYDMRSQYISPNASAAIPRGFAVNPAHTGRYPPQRFDPPFYAQLPEAGPSSKHLEQDEAGALPWDDDVEMNDADAAAERAVEENDAIRLEQARRWAAEQSMRMNQTLDRAGLRELVRLLLQLNAWGVSSADFTERGVRQDLLQAVYNVVPVAQRPTRPPSPPPPPPVDSLPTPPPPPPPAQQHSRRASIASSVEMDIATPSPQSQPITVDPTPPVASVPLPVTSNPFLSNPPESSAPQTSSASAAGEMFETGLAPGQSSLGLESTATPSSETASETKSANDVTLMRAKLLAHKLRKQKEIRERLRKLQAAATSVESTSEPQIVPNIPIPPPLAAETPPSDADSVAPSITTAKAVELSPLQSFKSIPPKTPDLDNQTPIVTDSSQFFPIRAKPVNRGRKALAPAHPKSFIIDLDSDSDDDEAGTSEQSRTVAAALEAEKRHTESLRKEIEKKEAARAALEARIAAMEARRQAKKAQAAAVSIRETKTVVEKTITVTSTVPDVNQLPRGESFTPQSTLGTTSSQDQSSAEAEAAALLRMIEESHAAAEDMDAAKHVDPQNHSTIDLTEDTLPDEDEDIEMVVVPSSPMTPSISLFPDGSVPANPEETELEPGQSISHGHAVERVDQVIKRSARDAFDPVMLSDREKAPRYTSYTSLLPLIPVAAANPTKMQTRRSIPSAPPPSFLDATGQLDDSVLESIIWTRLARTKPDATICVYEVEGGTCSDTSCGNIHLSRDIDPTPEDLLQLVSIVVPASSPAQSKLQAAAAKVFDPKIKKATAKKAKTVKGKKKTKAGKNAIDTMDENAVAGSSTTPANAIASGSTTPALADDQASAQANAEAVKTFLRAVERAISVNGKAV